MSYPTTAPAQVIGIPVKGMNTRNSPLSMDPQTSLWLQDVDTDGQRLTTRNEFELYGSIDTNNTIVSLGVWGDPSSSTSKLFAYGCSGGNNTVLLGNGDGTFAVVLTTASGGSSQAAPVNYKNNLAFNVPTNVSAESARTADGTTWGNVGFTTGATHIPARCACEYKGRVYLMNGSTLYYSALSAVTGACSSVDLSDFFRYTMFPGFLATLSSAGDRPSETYLAIGSAAGEILVYGGDYPASATWSLVGRYKVPLLCGIRSAIEINNDIWIMTLGGIVSLRALMNSGDQALNELSPTYDISLYWNKLQAGFLGTGNMYSGYSNVSAAHWPEKNKLYVFVPYWVSRTSPLAFDYATGILGTILVYDLAARAWTVHKISVPTFTKLNDVTNTTYGSLTYFQNNIYFVCGKNIYRYGTGYMDDEDPTRGGTEAILWAIEGAHGTYGGFGNVGTIKGWNALLDQDHLSGSIQFRTIVDLGRAESAASTPALVDGINSIAVLCGGVGTIFQYSLLGYTNASMTGPVELYSMGVIK